MFSLRVTSLDGKSSRVPLAGTRLSLGRASDNDLAFPEDGGLSRRHLLLEQDGGVWYASDPGSKNGTLVNGQRLAGRQILRSGDQLTASRVRMVFEADERTVVFDAAADLSGVRVGSDLPTLLKQTPLNLPLWNAPATALLRAGRELAGRRPLSELFPVILHLSLEAVGACRGVLITQEDEGLTVKSSHGQGFRISTTVRDRVLRDRASLLVLDTQREDSLRDQVSIVGQAVRSFMAVPLQTDERVLGLIYVDTPRGLREFTPEDLDLLTVMANVAAMRIERERLTAIEQAERLLAAELRQAAEIQRSFLPAAAPSPSGLDVAGSNLPCRSVGGDYFDFLEYPERAFGFVVADVAGKGMPAALLMTSLQARVHALAEEGCGPGTMAARLNRGLAPTFGPNHRFVTLFGGVIAPDGELAYCNAGHNPPFLLRRGDVSSLACGGPVLGILAGAVYPEERIALEPGDLLLLYSDGVTEAFNPREEEFGEDRLLAVLRTVDGAPARAVVDAVLQAVADWQAGQPAADDITVVALRRT